MLIDSHIHVGQFWDNYYSPEFISRYLQKVGVTTYAVSSTTICSHDYPKVIQELETLLMLDGDKVLPIMWITPDCLKGNIAWFLESAIPWRCLKVHPFLNQSDWNPNGELFADVIEIARELSLPLLIHTDTDFSCHANKYEVLYQDNPCVNFILAHGRPNNEAIRIVQEYKNVFVDSAFMPIDEMKKFIENGLCNKLLWGTDMCIPKHFFPKINLESYYMEKISAFRAISTEDEFNQVTHRNAMRVFKINNNK